MSVPSDRALEALLDSITPMDHVNPYFKGMIYGESGTGKTIAAARAVQNKGLYVDSGEGWVSLINFPDLRSKLSRMEYAGLSQLEAVADAIEAGISPWDQYDTIILDEASTIAVMDLDVVLATRAKQDPSKNADMPTQPDYGFNTERCRRTFTKLLKLDCNVVFTAHLREDKDERTGKVYTRPLFTPKLRNTISQWMHLIGHLTMTEHDKDGEAVYHRRLQVQPSANIVAKSRIGGLPPFLENPDLGRLIRDWQNSGAAVDETPQEILDLPDAGPIVEEENKSVEADISI